MIKVLIAMKLEFLDRHEGPHHSQGHHGRGILTAIPVGVGYLTTYGII